LGSARPGAVIVRRRGGGETLKPAKSASTQSLQHLCQSQGVLPWLRDALPLVFAGDAPRDAPRNELIAVADLWMDARWCAAPDEPGLAIKWSGAPIVC
jgi:tRNA(Ile)-lysidine synthase